MKSGERVNERNWEALYRETAKRLDELSILYDMTRISAASLNLNQMLKEMTQGLCHFFRCDWLGVFLFDEGGKHFTLHPVPSEDSPASLEGPAKWAAENGQSVLIPRLREDSRFAGTNGEILSEMCALMKAGDRIIGIIDGRSKKENAFSEDDLRLLEKTGDHLASIVDNVRSEERYRGVVEGALDGVIVLGEDHRVIYVNERLVDLLGYTKEELIGMDFLVCLDEESKQRMIDRHLRVLRREEVSPQFELNVLRKKGGMKNIEVSSTRINDSRGNMNTVAFLKDITEKRKMEEQLLQTEKLRALGEMAGGIAHDFNNSLAIILGNTQLLIYTAPDGELKETLKTIEKVARESAQTVRRLLEFTRKGSREELVEVDLNAVTRDAVELTRPKWEGAESRGGRIETVLHLEDTLLVAGMLPELREVITSVISNAVEAMPEGGRLEIRSYQRDGKACIQISDTGSGMTEYVKGKIFEPFFTTKPFSNRGLGLSMSYGIIKRIGGEIKVESKPEQGTTFTIVLPIRIAGEGMIMPPGGRKEPPPERGQVSA